MKTIHAGLLVVPLCFLLHLASGFLTGASAQNAWQLFKEAPMGVVPVQIEQGNDGTLYVMSNRGVMYYRQNGAPSWSIVQNMQAWWNVTSFALDPETNRLFLSTDFQGIRFTDNFGETWGLEHLFTTDAGLHATVFDILPYDDSNIILLGAGFNFELGFHANYRSVNNGATWETLQAPSVMLSLFRTSSGRVIGVTDDFGLFVSDNDGDTWTSVGMQGIRMGDFAETNEGHIYATVKQAVQPEWTGVWVSEDDGVNWMQQNQGLSIASANAISYLSAADQLLLATDHGLYERIGGLWVETPNSLSAAPSNDVLITPVKVYTGMPVFGVQASTTTSDDWVSENEGFPAGMDAFAFNAQNDVIASYSNGRGIYLAAETDSEWDVQFLPENSFAPLAVKKISRASNGKIYVMDFDELFVSVDEGLSFQNITPDLLISLGGFSIQLKEMSIAENGEVLIAQAFDNRVLHSMDGGATFEVLVDAGDINEPFFVEQIRRSDTGHYYLVVQTAMNKRLYHSAEGNQWEALDLSAVADESTAVGFALNRTADGEIIISLNHTPYIIQDVDQSLQPIPVPWFFENPNAVFDFAMDSQGTSYVLCYPTFGSLSYEGIWRSNDGGETWLNIGLPTNEEGIPMETVSIGFNQDDVPFVISGEAFTDLPRGLYYYGEEGLFNMVEESGLHSLNLKLYPNPVQSNGQVTVDVVSLNSGGRLLITDLQLKQCLEMFVSSAEPVSIPIGHLRPGVYLVHWIEENGGTLIKRLLVH